MIDEQYMIDNALHLSVGAHIDKRLIAVQKLGEKKRFRQRELQVYFEAVANHLFEYKSRYEQKWADEIIQHYDYDMYIFSKKELEKYNKHILRNKK